MKRTTLYCLEEPQSPTAEDDPRIANIGKWMRKARFDELPQLFNVLKGEMSLIGPRPERPYFVEKFKKTNPNYTYRFMVKPGMTGLAQIMGKYTSTPEDKLRFDLMYVQNYSLLLDIKILFRTFYILFKRESSNGVKKKEKIIKQE
ncbi:sugar transferase [Bacillus taeanensis]|nr:sugar transferase [Bacillus taeanensis]